MSEYVTQVVERPAAPAPAACVCGHLPVDHDAIAARYCRATISGDMERGCICTPIAR